MEQGQSFRACSAELIAEHAKDRRVLETFGHKVEIEESLLVFRIFSKNRESVYVVDLASHRSLGGELNGVCTCADFAARCEPNLHVLGEVRPYADGHPHRTQCKHIELARRIALNETLWRLAALRKDLAHHEG